MGWSSGSDLAEQVWDMFEEYLPSGNLKKKLAQELICLFENFDCDTMDKCIQLQLDAGYNPEDE